jgi:mannose-1-phosphate guanylyltransferase
VRRALVNTHHHADLVRRYLLSGPWRGRVVLAHEDSLLGTGGTILANGDFIDTEPVIVAHADNLTAFDTKLFIAAHRVRQPGTFITMMTFTTADPSACGIVTTDAQGIVTGFFEKVANPPGNRANAAVYIFEPEVISFMRQLKRSFVDISLEVLPHFVGRINTWHNDVYHRDIGTLESLAAAQRDYPFPPPEAPHPDPWESVLSRLAPEARALLSSFAEAGTRHR